MLPTLLLFRHALATRSLTGYGDTILSAEILPEGIPPIQRMAEFLKTIESDQNFVSPVKRCQQTAAIITEISGKIFTTHQHLSEYRGENRAETLEDFHARCQQFLDEQVVNTSAKTILVCAHGAVVGAIKNLLTTHQILESNVGDYPATGELWMLRNGEVEAFDFN